ncbi:MAG: signal recognition particle-docking protein FtsY [Candidatus Micrarchaeia archaeon]
MPEKEPFGAEPRAAPAPEVIAPEQDEDPKKKAVPEKGEPLPGKNQFPEKAGLTVLKEKPVQPEGKTPSPKVLHERPRAEGKEHAAKPDVQPEPPKERMKLGIVGTVKSLISREVEITEKDVGQMLDDLELELLEADVELSVAQGIREELAGRLVGKRIKKDELHRQVGDSIKETIVDVLTNDRAFDIVDRASAAEKPLKVAFLGINGAGKTTTIAKVAKLLMDNDRKVVFAAADTFRAAAIEQMAVHAERLGVRLIKRDYGSDPTSVAYDAVNYAKAHNIDAVLIDTAGRQDTNISLINEMKKMVRVIQPDLKIYIGESIAGNAIIEQIATFNREIGIDAVILTKLDCDPKGGTMLSINRATGIPIIYLGIGQGYGDLERFDAKKIAGRIVD